MCTKHNSVGILNHVAGEALTVFVVVCPADARTLVQQARNEAAEYRHRYGYEMPADGLARWYAYLQILSSIGGNFGFNVNMIVSGIWQIIGSSVDE